MSSPTSSVVCALAAILLSLGCGSDAVGPGNEHETVYDFQASFETLQVPAACSFPLTGNCVRIVSTHGMASVVGTMTVNDTLTTSAFGAQRAMRAEATLQACTSTNLDLGCTTATAPRSQHLVGEVQYIAPELAGMAAGIFVLRGDAPFYPRLTLQPSGDAVDGLSGTAQWLDGNNATYSGQFVAHRR